MFRQHLPPQWEGETMIDMQSPGVSIRLIQDEYASNLQSADLYPLPPPWQVLGNRIPCTLVLLLMGPTQPHSYIDVEQAHIYTLTLSDLGVSLKAYLAPKRQWRRNILESHIILQNIQHTHTNFCILVTNIHQVPFIEPWMWHLAPSRSKMPFISLVVNPLPLAKGRLP